MTAQSASRVSSLAASLKSKVAAVYKHTFDLLIVFIVGAALLLLAVPVAHHIYSYWHTFASVWAPQAPQKAIQKRATP